LCKRPVWSTTKIPFGDQIGRLHKEPYDLVYFFRYNSEFVTIKPSYQHADYLAYKNDFAIRSSLPFPLQIH
jgi:hypothetical protein